MKLVKEKLIPTFEKNLDKKMALVVDNAAYYYNRVIISLPSLSKGKIVDIMVKYNVKYIDLPFESVQRQELAEMDDDEEVQDREDCVWISLLKME